VIALHLCFILALKTQNVGFGHLLHFAMKLETAKYFLAVSIFQKSAPSEKIWP
jgi:hypothetical protein